MLKCYPGIFEKKKRISIVPQMLIVYLKIGPKLEPPFRSGLRFRLHIHLFCHKRRSLDPQHLFPPPISTFWIKLKKDHRSIGLTFPVRVGNKRADKEICPISTAQFPNITLYYFSAGLNLCHVNVGEVWTSAQVPAALPQVPEGLDLAGRVEQVPHSEDLLVHTYGNFLGSSNRKDW